MGVGWYVLFSLLAPTLGLLSHWLLQQWRNRKSLPPGPLPWPLAGNLPEISRHPRPLSVLMDYKKKYGDLFTIYIGPTPTVVLSNITLVREAFLQKQIEFAGRAISYAGDLFSYGGKDIVFSQYSPVWTVQRKIAHTAIRKYASGQHFERLVRNSADQVSVCLEDLARKGEPFDPFEVLSLLIYNIISSMTFGKMFELKDPVFKEFIRLNEEANEALRDGLLADMFPVFSTVPTKAVRTLKKLMSRFDNTLEEIYRDHLDNYDPANVTDLTYTMIDTLMRLEDEHGKESLDELTSDHFKGIIGDIFFAGTDTSRFTLYWALQYIAGHPDVQQRIQREIDDVVGRDQPVLMAHRPHLAYTEATLHEVMRIKTIAPLGLPHKTLADTSVGGYHIPEGTHVMVNTWALHMDPAEWKDPESFRPERFLDEDGNLAPRSNMWLPFSTGRRVCVGEALAKSALHLSVAYLCQRFTFTPPSGVKYEYEAKPLMTLLICEPYKIMAERR